MSRVMHHFSLVSSTIRREKLEKVHLYLESETSIHHRLSNEKKRGWLGYIGNDTIQSKRDHIEPSWGSLLTNQYNGK